MFDLANQAKKTIDFIGFFVSQNWKSSRIVPYSSAACHEAEILSYFSAGNTHRQPIGSNRLPLLVEKNTTHWQKLIEIVEVAHIACENDPAAFQRLEI